MNRVLVTLIVLTGTLTFRVAFAQEPAPLSVTLRQLQSSSTLVQAVATVHGAAESPSLHTVEHGADLRSSAHKEPLDLWLVLDNSALCAKYRADQTLSTWATALARELPAASRVSLLTFRRGAFEMLATQQSLDSLPLGKVHCQVGSVSAEPERALAYMNETEIPPGLSRAVWILSSGNASVSQKTLTKLRENGTELSLIFYNPFVFTALAPLFDSLRATMGEGLFHAQPLDSAELPSHTYRLQAALPNGSGNSLALVARVQARDRKAASSVATVALPPAAGPSLLHQILVGLAYLLVALAVLYCLYRVVRYYRPRHCAQCSSRLRFSDSTCAFCYEAEGAYLVAAAPLAINTLDKEQTQVGTHRRSAIRVLRRVGEKRAVYFRIHRRSESFRLQTAGLPVYVNGLPVTASRFLASGDRIRVAGAEFKFVQNSRSTQRV